MIGRLLAAAATVVVERVAAAPQIAAQPGHLIRVIAQRCGVLYQGRCLGRRQVMAVRSSWQIAWSIDNYTSASSSLALRSASSAAVLIS